MSQNKQSFWQYQSAELYPEVYLTPSCTSTMEAFLRKYLTAKSIDHFCKKSSIVDVRMCSKYASVQLFQEIFSIESNFIDFPHWQ